MPNHDPIKDTFGAKYDEHKLRYDLIPPEAIEELAKLYTFGATKYDDRNWQKGIKFGRLYGALMRHLESHRKGENYDSESKCHHLACVMFYCAAMIAFEKHLPEMDDRKEALNYGPNKPAKLWADCPMDWICEYAGDPRRMADVSEFFASPDVPL